MALRNRHSTIPCKNSERIGTLPGWNLEISGAASHPYDQCLWRNDLKFFLQEQDTRNYSFPQIGKKFTNKSKHYFFLKYMYLGTSLVVQCPQCRGHRFNPWSRKIPHATEQLSLCGTTTEAPVPRAWAPQEKPLQWEEGSPQWRAALLAVSRESPCAATKTQCNHK